MEDKLKQEQTSGSGSTLYQAGRDIHQTTINYSDRLKVMEKLVKLYNEEKKKGTKSEFTGYIRKLEKFTTSIDGELSDLQQKLEAGGYKNDIDWALELKEEYSKMLQENKFSQACQHIHAYLLAWIIVLFKQFVADAIKSGQTKDTVKQIIVDKVIAPVENLVGGENNVLELYSDDITGMIYYLTGNCHLKWN
jgi:C-terminal domain 9 of the ABC-three component (ABC-3C) systems